MDIPKIGPGVLPSSPIRCPSLVPPSNLSRTHIHPPLQPPPTQTIDDQYIDLSQGYKGPLHETTLIGGVTGFYYFKNLYALDGILYAVTDHPSSLPLTSEVVSDMPDADGNPRPGTEKSWRVISTRKASSILGSNAARLPGTTMFFNDGPGHNGFLAHYFHFVCEAFAGAWRILRSVGELRLPSRIIFSRDNEWRDHAMMNAWFLNSVLPTTPIEDARQWVDRAFSDITFVFETVIVVDRHTAHRHGTARVNKWNKMAGDAYVVPAPEDWWGPIRRAMIASLNIPDDVAKPRPVIAYIDRQRTTRRILEPDHEALLQALDEIREEGLAEVYDAVMEELPKREQFEISTQTDIMVGVHGNGLSHQMWMKPGGVVIEIMFPGGFTRDYQMLTETVQHDYYAIWNDTVRTRAEWEPLGTIGIDGFHGPNIPLHAEFLKGLLRTILKEKYGMTS